MCSRMASKVTLVELRDTNCTVAGSPASTVAAMPSAVLISIASCIIDTPFATLMHGLNLE